MGYAALKMDCVDLGPARVVIRLEAWARWLEGSRTGVNLGYGGCTIAAVVDGGGQFVRSTAPANCTDMPDAIYQVERAVCQLEPTLKLAVFEHYRHPDAPLSKRLAVCECSRATYYRRLKTAHTHLMMLLVPERRPTQSAARDRILARVGNGGV